MITRIVRRNQLKLLGFEQKDSSFFRLPSAVPAPIEYYSLIHQLTCQGLALEALDIRSSAGTKVIYVAAIEVINVD